MLTQTSQLIGQRGYKKQTRNRLLVTSCGCRVSAADTHPQRLHTVSTRCPPPLHSLPTCTHEVDVALFGPPLRCRPVRTTPLYDQLRGERINADVPPSARPQQLEDRRKHRLAEGDLEDRGKHRLADGDLGSVTGCNRAPRTAADRANADVAPRDSDPQQRDHSTKHHLPDGEPDVAAAVTRRPRLIRSRPGHGSQRPS